MKGGGNGSRPWLLEHASSPSEASARKSAGSVIVACVLLVLIWLCRIIPGWADFYSLHIYPIWSGVVSLLTCWIPFSLEEILVVAAVIGVVFCLFRIRRRYIVLINILLWVAVWFYAGWGLNYYRSSIYQRAEKAPSSYESAAFASFLEWYTSSLEEVIDCADKTLDTEDVEKDIKSYYTGLSDKWGLSRPKKWQHPKKLLFDRLYSGVGVLGFVGPFFNEIQINGDVLPRQYAYTYAHELSHLLGVSSEAEANYWAFKACSGSSSPEIRYSGYQSLLPYVVGNASRILPEEEYRKWLETVPEKAVEAMREESAYWNDLYSPFVGKIQDKMYNLYLKGNKVSEGTADYSGVVRMILSLDFSSRGN